MFGMEPQRAAGVQARSRTAWILGRLAGTRGRLEAEEYGVAFLRVTPILGLAAGFPR